jgi:hypothetical protein
MEEILAGITAAVNNGGGGNAVIDIVALISRTRSSI